MITVLLSSYNGEKYIEEQLDSLLAQKNVEIQIFVRDDGSTDRTHEILDSYQNRGLLTWYTGENLKPAGSFLDLINHAPDSEYYALCDQDDYWLDDKLQIAVSYLETFSENTPALYYGRPRLVDGNLKNIKNPSTSLDSMTDFYSSIIASNATGCTMVFNRALLKKVQKKTPLYVEMHDAWIHKVCLIFQGNLCFDKDVHILYRQHGDNAVGISNSLVQKIKRRVISLRYKQCVRSRTIQSLLECYGDQMHPEHRDVAKIVVNYRNGIQNKIKLLFCRKIKTKYFYRNIFFRMAVLLNAF